MAAYMHISSSRADGPSMTGSNAGGEFSVSFNARTLDGDRLPWGVARLLRLRRRTALSLRALRAAAGL
jgi:hypothetical protein